MCKTLLLKVNAKINLTLKERFLWRISLAAVNRKARLIFFYIALYMF